MFKKPGRDEVIMALQMYKGFSVKSDQGGFRTEQEYVNEGPLLQKNSSSEWKATATTRTRSSDLKACG